MNDLDYLNLYLSGFNGIGLKSIEKERQKANNADLLKIFKTKNNQISKSDYLKWKRDFKAKIERENISIIKEEDPLYPQSLYLSKDHPKYLFAKGNLDLLSQNIFAIVGSRNPTSYGINNTKEISHRLSSAGFVIISGLAIGIDSVAHQNAIHNGTIAILGSGFDHIYPSTNTSLYLDILKNNGLVLTEYLPQTEPYPAYFPMRSRIIAGLSSGLLVSEAREDSGSLIAANLSFDCGKNVYALPADVSRLSSQGCNLLIMRNIAKLITSAEDILEDYSLSKTKFSGLEKERYIPEEYREVINFIKNGTTDIDRLSIKLNIGQDKFLTLLTEMELEGFIEKNGGEISIKV